MHVRESLLYPYTASRLRTQVVSRRFAVRRSGPWDDLISREEEGPGRRTRGRAGHDTSQETCLSLNEHSSKPAAAKAAAGSTPADRSTESPKGKAAAQPTPSAQADVARKVAQQPKGNLR